MQTGTPLNFYTVVEAARRRGEVAIGYRRAGHGTDKARAYGVVVNPNKAEIVTFDPDDMVIVIGGRLKPLDPLLAQMYTQYSFAASMNMSIWRRTSNPLD